MDNKQKSNFMIVYLMQNIKLSYPIQQNCREHFLQLNFYPFQLKLPTLTSLNSRFGRDGFCRRAGLQPTHALFGEEGGCCNCRGDAHSQSEPLCMTCCLQSCSYGEDGENIWSLPEAFWLPMERPQADQQKQVFAGSGEMSCGTSCLTSPQCRFYK